MRCSGSDAEAFSRCWERTSWRWKCSHVFNLLDARGAISVTERVGVMARIRALVVGVAKAYARQGELLAQESVEVVAG